LLEVLNLEYIHNGVLTLKKEGNGKIISSIIERHMRNLSMTKNNMLHKEEDSGQMMKK